jgi:putative NADH-flavin reductase
MYPCKLIVIGAAHGTGLQVVSQALAAGHDVTALSRSAARMDIEDERLRKITCILPQDSTLLADAMAGQTVVISTLGRGLSLSSHHLIEQCVPSILGAMRTHGVRRLIFTSAIGVGDAGRDAPLVSRVAAQTLLRSIYADKVIGERLVRESGLDWTIVQPAQLTDGPLTGRYRAAERLPMHGVPKISRADVAHFLLAQIGDSLSIGKTLTVAY